MAGNVTANAPDRTPLLFASLRGFRIAWLPDDVLAGLLLAAIALPQQLATARLAGMPPATGLIAFIGGTLGFAVFGTNRFLSCGADSTIAPIFAGGIAAIAITGATDYAHAASLLALLVGGILVAAALLRAGWVADLLSAPVITGLLAGIAVHIVVGQLAVILGVPDTSGALLSRLLQFARHLPDTRPAALAVGAGVLAIALLTERFAPRVPGALIGVILAIVAVAVGNLRQHGVVPLGEIPPIALHPTLPTVVTFGEVEPLLPLALIVALVCMMQSATVLRSFPSNPDGPRHVSRDFGGVGAGCILAGLFGGFAVNASPPCTAVVRDGGGRTQIAGMVAVVVAVVLGLFGGPVLAIIPQAALGGLLVSVAIRIFRLNEMTRIARYGGSEIWLLAASAGLVILLPIQNGMLAAIVLSLVHSFTIIARPLCTELLRVPGTTIWWPPNEAAAEKREPGVLVFALGAPLNFTNASFVCGLLAQAVAARPAPPHLVVLEASGMIDIDYTGSRVLQQTIGRLRDAGITVALARLSAERAQQQAGRTGLTDMLGAELVFRSVDEAVTKLRTNPE
jgi:MFS superfamily sulfate permease-like transporter